MYTKTKPRKWEKQDIERLKELQEKGYNKKEIAKIMNRTEVSIGIKIKRLQKKSREYNKGHIEEKIKLNTEFEELIKPESILNCYSGGGTLL